MVSPVSDTLVVEAQGGVSQGNANPGLYSLLTARSNPFHATPSGGNGVPGVAGFTAGGEAYNLATGLGSVDGAALVNNWGERAGSVAAEAPGLTLTAGERLAEVVRGGADSVVFSVGTAGAVIEYALNLPRKTETFCEPRPVTSS